MKIKLLLLVNLLSASCINPDNPGIVSRNSNIQLIYNQSGLNNIIPYNVFSLALTGLQKIDSTRNKHIISIIDYSQPSNLNRFFVIDLENRKLLYKCMVAHGRNSGDIITNSFSNDPESLKSCLGFFLTAETYYGKNGYSLSLDGLEPGINDNARMRAIVIHGADYVSGDFISKYGRIGRSWGCPALPSAVSRDIIDHIKNGTCLFVYANDKSYLTTSRYIR